jgi:hypothetical protein
LNESASKSLVCRHRVEQARARLIVLLRVSFHHKRGKIKRSRPVYPISTSPAVTAPAMDYLPPNTQAFLPHNWLNCLKEVASNGCPDKLRRFPRSEL